MKVYNISAGTERLIVAAPSKKAAVEALTAAGRNWLLPIGFGNTRTRGAHHGQNTES